VSGTIEVPFEYVQTLADTPAIVSFDREEVLVKVGLTEEQRREREEEKKKQEEKRKELESKLEEDRKKQEEIARERGKNAWRTSDSSIMAELKVRDAVKRRLKSPSTAKFPGIFDTEHWATPIGDSVEDQVYMVQS